ncbi:hypothetical protein VNO78_00794 [Psophocarpus tetragonolobus]|uniref:Uncharacterized protein n=1 Tax=Psophocarpus tetragonolobus TaxID=3891 RepID=A0AAN9SXF4_PSOTE
MKELMRKRQKRKDALVAPQHPKRVHSEALIEVRPSGEVGPTGGVVFDYRPAGFRCSYCPFVGDGPNFLFWAEWFRCVLCECCVMVVFVIASLLVHKGVTPCVMVVSASKKKKAAKATEELMRKHQKRRNAPVAPQHPKRVHSEALVEVRPSGEVGPTGGSSSTTALLASAAAVAPSLAMVLTSSSGQSGLDVFYASVV